MICTLSGENDLLRQEALQQRVAHFLSEYSDMGLERLDGEEVSYGRMHEAAQSLPFLAERKLVILRSPGANKEFTEKFEAFLDDVAETNDILIIEPKLDKRLAYYKSLKKLTEFHNFTVLDVNGMTRFLVGYAKDQGGELTSSTARVLIDRVGINQLLLRHEVDKLLSYAPTIDRSAIELLTERTPQSSIFELLDTAFSGNAAHAIQLYDEQRSLKVEPQQIIAMLVWQLYIVSLVKTAKDRSAEEIAKQAKISPFTIRKSQNLARHITLKRLKELLAILREFDVRLKSEALVADEVVRYYLLQLAQ